jgi:L-amino acid N-acyltransferase YncA
MIPCSFVPVSADHLQRLADILNHYVLNTTYTFHQKPLEAEEMREKVFFTNPIHQGFAILEDDLVIGFCAVSQWKKQESYRHTAEINIYLDHEFPGKGMGSVALSYLEDHARSQDIQNLIAGICIENTPSIRLFEKNGYRQCAHFKNVGLKFGRELDVIYLQKRIG